MGGSIQASCNYSFYCYSSSPGDWGSAPAAACQTARDLDQKGHSPPFQLGARTAGYLPSLRPPKSSDPRSWRARSPSRRPTVSQNSCLATASPPYLLLLSSPIAGTAPPSTPPPAGDWTLSWTPAVILFCHVSLRNISQVYSLTSTLRTPLCPGLAFTLSCPGSCPSLLPALPAYAPSCCSRGAFLKHKPHPVLPHSEPSTAPRGPQVESSGSCLQPHHKLLWPLTLQPHSLPWCQAHLWAFVIQLFLPGVPSSLSPGSRCHSPSETFLESISVSPA